jgi:hypothetical protein
MRARSVRVAALNSLLFVRDGDIRDIPQIDGAGSARSTAIDDPNRRVIVETVLGRAILEIDVPDVVTRVQVWANGSRDTDKIVIAVSQVAGAKGS